MAGGTPRPLCDNTIPLPSIALMDARSQAAKRQFRYVRDTVFLAAVIVYLVNRFVVKPLTGSPDDFFHCYLNDVLCVAFWLPSILWFSRRIGLRTHDEAPTVGEILLHVAAWSWLFEYVAPAPGLRGWFPNAVGDPWDVVAYGSGGLVAGLLWGSRSRPARSEVASPIPGRPLLHRAIALAIVMAAIVAAALSLSGNAWQSRWRRGADSWLAYVATPDGHDALTGGSLLGIAIASAWLLWSRRLRPPYRVVTLPEALAAVAAVGVSLSAGLIVLELQNDLSMPSGH